MGQKVTSRPLDPWPVHLGFVVGKVRVEKVFLLEIRVFPYQSHSTNAALPNMLLILSS